MVFKAVNGASTQAELFKRYVCVCINAHAPLYSAAAWLLHLQNKSGAVKCRHKLFMWHQEVMLLMAALK